MAVGNRPGDRRDAADAIRRVDPGIEKQSHVFNAKRRLRWVSQLEVEGCPGAQMDRVSKGICPFDPGRNTPRTCRGPGRADCKATVGFRAERLIDPAIGIPIDLKQRGLWVDPIFTGDELSYQRRDRGDPVGAQDAIVAQQCDGHRGGFQCRISPVEIGPFPGRFPICKRIDDPRTKTVVLGTDYEGIVVIDDEARVGLPIATDADGTVDLGIGVRIDIKKHKLMRGCIRNQVD